MNQQYYSETLYPAEFYAWDETEKERQTVAGREVLERIRLAGRDGSGTVRISSGNYRFPGREGILLEEMRDISLEADGAVFWFTPEVEAGLHFRNCRNVRLSGVTFDIDGLPFLQGVLLEVRDRELTIRLSDYFMTRFREQKQDHFRLMFLDADGRSETDNLDFIVSREEVAADHKVGILRIPVTERQTEHWHYQLRQPRPGDRVALGMRHEGGMLLVDGCEAMTFEDVTVYASPCFAFYENGHGNGGNTYRRCRLIRRPGTDRLLASSADCFHSMDQFRGPLIEDCEFSWAMDDLVNIHGYFNVVTGQTAENEILVVTPYGTCLRENTELTFFSAPDGMEKFHARLVSRHEENRDEEAGFQQVRAIYGEKYGISLQRFPGGTVCRLKLDRPVRTEPGDFLCGYDGCGRGAVLRRNRFHDSHVRGILLKSADCRIENNRFERIALNGIILEPEFFWLEGPMPRNIVIRDNILTDCAFGYTAGAAILVMCGCCAPPSGRITAAVNMENISILHNEINSCNAGAGIAVFNTKNPRVAGNRIKKPFSNQLALGQLDFSARLDCSAGSVSREERSGLQKARSAIVFINSANVECRENTLIDPDEWCTVACIGPGCSVAEDSGNERIFRPEREDQVCLSC